MTDVIKIGKQKRNDVVFVGKAWINKAKNGNEYISISFDRGTTVSFIQIDQKTKIESAYELAEGANIQMFSNTKREGKKDADYRLSFRLPKAE